MSKQNIPDSVLFYAAGIIDGEGTITLSRQSSSSKFRIPVVSCSSTTLEILEFLKSNFGGSISKHKVYKEHHKQSWSWKVQGDAAIYLCCVINPHLLEPDKRFRSKHIADHYKRVTRRNGKYTQAEHEEKLLFESTFFRAVVPC